MGFGPRESYEKFHHAWMRNQGQEFFNNQTSKVQQELRDFFKDLCESYGHEPNLEYCCDILGFCPFPTWAIVLIVILVLAVVVGGGVAFWYFYLKRKRGGKDNNNEMESRDDSDEK